jgi:hypothetical protein
MADPCEFCGQAWIGNTVAHRLGCPSPDGPNAGSFPGGRAAEQAHAWDRFALEAMRQILYMAPESLAWSDKMADTPALFADRVAEVADRLLEKRQARFPGGSMPCAPARSAPRVSPAGVILGVPIPAHEPIARAAVEAHATRTPASAALADAAYQPGGPVPAVANNVFTTWPTFAAALVRQEWKPPCSWAIERGRLLSTAHCPICTAKHGECCYCGERTAPPRLRCAVTAHGVGERLESRRCTLSEGHAFDHKWEGE